MAETTQFVSRISVKDLISAFESKSETVKVQFSRPRARSFGNVLNKNVIIRLNEFTTLEDIEKGLTKLETNLNFYEVYNKAKHVAFQEQFFNILTSIANIENDDDDDAPARKKRLISRTQTLVSFLNQKLPSNINQVVEDKPKNQYTYTPYSSYVKSNPKTESKPKNYEETKLSNGTDAQPDLYVESSNTVDVTDSGDTYIVSVKKLKENFLPKGEKPVEEPIKQETNKVNKKPTGNSSKSATSNTKKSDEPKQVPKQPSVQIIEKETPKGDIISVTKLRSLFEQRSEESSKGLEVITVDKSQLTKNILGGSAQNISIPFTERNLGTFRLQRSVSGNYMNYSGLLKRIDINRSKSAFDVNKDGSPLISEDEDSGAESNTMEEDEIIVDEEETQKQSLTNNAEREHAFVVKKSEDVRHSTKSELEENNNTKEYTLSNGTAALISKFEQASNSPNSQNIAHHQGFREEGINYSSANIEGVKTNHEELVFKGVDETEVKSGVSVSQAVSVEEYIAKFEANTTQLEVTSASERNKTSSEELVFKGVDETEVKSGVSVSQAVLTEEHTAKFEADTVQSEATYASEANKTNHEELVFEGVDETEVKSGVSVSQAVSVEEYIAKFEANTTELEARSASERNKTSSEELVFKGVDETEVKSEVPVSEAVLSEEHVAKFEADTAQLASEGNMTSSEELVFKGVDETEVKSGVTVSQAVLAEEHTAKFEADAVLLEATSASEGNKTSSEELVFKGVDETEVKSGVPVSEAVPSEEHTATFEADTTQFEATSASEIAKDENNTNTEQELTFNGIDEVQVNSGVAESQNIQAEENIATLEVTAEESQSATITATDEHVTENSKDDETTSSAFSSLMELEDERERSLMEEEMKKIDVEQTLANADIVVNPEDLKNADDEFEKLIENSESGKVIG